MKVSKLAACLFACIFFCGLTTVAASAQARPALTQDVDQPGRNTFTFASNTLTGGVVYFTVPAGKRYVIELYTGDCAVPNTTSILDVEIVAYSNGAQGIFHTPVHFVENVGFGVVRYAGTGSGPIYADPGTSINMGAMIGTSHQADFRGCTFIISGHVINNP